jgi:mersacidin/lichenicidin family type 2 lantibiotic
MSDIDIIRAWKDEDYRNSLSPEQRALLPENPAGMVELEDGELAGIEGGTSIPCISAVTAVTKLLTCSVNCNTVFQGTCGAWSVGCCG